MTARAFPGHRRNAYPAVLGAIVMAIVAETAGAHFLLRLWTPIAAWVSTALGVYTIVWLVRDFRTARDHPTRVTDESLVVDVGLRWHAVVPWSLVAAVSAQKPPEGGRRMTLFGAPDFWLELREPIEVTGPFGARVSARFLGIGADEAGELRREVEGRMVGD